MSLNKLKSRLGILEAENTPVIETWADLMRYDATGGQKTVLVSDKLAEVFKEMRTMDLKELCSRVGRLEKADSGKTDPALMSDEELERRAREILTGYPLEQDDLLPEEDRKLIRRVRGILSDRDTEPTELREGK